MRTPPCQSSPPSPDGRAFTRLELVALVAALALLALVVVPVLGEGKAKSQVAVCVNNLRLIGRAILTWDAEHGDTDPWRWPRPPEIQASGIFNNAWYEYVLMSNELATARILVCPSDTRRPARDFSFSPDGGFLNAAYRNQSVSYFLGLDSHVSAPDSILAGDRNLIAQGYGACSSGLSPVPFVDAHIAPTSRWG